MSVTTAADLALGTVQFGIAYGVAGRGEAVPPEEVRAILEAAAAGGMGMLDTAPAYGDIEVRLAALADGLPFSIVSKIAPAPDATRAAVDFVTASVERSIARLGDRLTTILFHQSDDLERSDADQIWRAATEAAGSRVRIGVSVYDPATIARLRRRFPIAVAQLPANALDQRLATSATADALAGIDLHARSVFLQGLLLMSRADVARRVPVAAQAHADWTAWCERERMTPVTAALSIVRALPGIARVIVGVDRLSQLREILEAAALAAPRAAAGLACDNLDVLDPRRWPMAAPVTGAVT